MPFNVFFIIRSFPSLAEAGSFSAIISGFGAGVNNDAEEGKFLKFEFGEDGPGKEEVQEGMHEMHGSKVSNHKDVIWPFVLVSLVILFFFNRPLKLYFKRLRKGKEVPPNIRRYARKYIYKAPYVNTMLFAMPIIIQMLYELYMMHNEQGRFAEPALHELASRMLYINMVVFVLVIVFSLLWQRTRTQLKYQEHVFSIEELQQQTGKRPREPLYRKLLVTNLTTTLLPLAIVFLYLMLSITQFRDLGIEKLTQTHKTILLGEFASMFNLGDADYNFFYVNAVDSVLMIFGITFSVLISLVYITVMAKWTAKTIIYPVNDLYRDMERTSRGELESYSKILVNDEIGDLTRGYNKMVSDLKRYFDDLEEMNRNLEQRVMERTQEIQQKKEEIEAQRDQLYDRKMEIETQRDEIIQQRDVLSQRNTEISDSINYARRIQEAVLPLEKQFAQKLSDHFILFMPRDVVSGDFYWIGHRGDDIIITAADCTGHGVPGAFMSMLGMTFLNEVVNYQHITQPHEILKALRNKIKQALRQHDQASKAKDGMDMALVKLNTQSLKMEFAGAYNPLYLMQDGELNRVKADRMPIGIHLREKPDFTNHHFQLKNGDSFYLFSDGYPDQFGEAERQKFKSGRMRKLIHEIKHLPMPEQGKIMEKRILEWKGSVSQTDDIIMIGVRV